jgi:putative transposase
LEAAVGEKKVSGTFVVAKTVAICSRLRECDISPYEGGGAMGRARRAADGGIVCHVLNRANARMPIFESDQDFAAFERILTEARDRYDMRILAYCLLSNHWHLVLWPKKDGGLSRFTGWVALTHTHQWHAHRHSAGTGHVDQSRFKSFPIQGDDHFYAVCRYAERNVLRALLVEQAEQWRWSSRWRWKYGTAEEKALLSAWPLPRPRDWTGQVNEPQTEAELEAIRRCVQRGQPFGDQRWTERIVRRLGLEATIRPRGRSRKAIKGS